MEYIDVRTPLQRWRDHRVAGSLFASWREEQGLTQVQLAESLRTRQATISGVERGWRPVPDRWLVVLVEMGLMDSRTADLIAMARDGRGED